MTVEVQGTLDKIHRWFLCLHKLFRSKCMTHTQKKNRVMIRKRINIYMDICTLNVPQHEYVAYYVTFFLCIVIHQTSDD